jgi:hypothetical protein
MSLRYLNLGLEAITEKRSVDCAPQSARWSGPARMEAVVLGGGRTQRLPRVVILSGEMISGQETHRIEQQTGAT